MARLPDEQWAMIEDSIDKKRTAASAFKQRAHCGKGGSVKFPSDYMTKKELKAMNGEVKSYRMNAPLSWEEFKELPSDLRANYVKSLREKFNVPDDAIAQMFDISTAKLTLYLLDMKLELVHDVEIWDKERFLAWRSGASIDAVTESEPVEETKYAFKPMKWEEFKQLSKPEKIAYIQLVRETFGAPTKNIAAMLGINKTYLSRVCTELGCNVGSASGATKKNWDSTEFDAWVRGDRAVEETTDIPVGVETVSEVEAAVEEIVDIMKGEDKPVSEIVPESRPEPVEATPAMAIPTYGELNFDCPADRALNTLAMVLGNKRVQLHVRWDVVEE